MAFSVPGFRRCIVYAFFLSAFFVSQALGIPEPMNEWELGGVEAGTGVTINFDNLVIENSGGSLKFIPDDVREPDNYVNMVNMSGRQSMNGDLSIGLAPYTAPQRAWFIKDTAKLGVAGIADLNAVFTHQRKGYQIVKPSDYRTDAEASGINALTLSMGNGTDVFMSRNSSMGLHFSAAGFVEDGTGKTELDSGTLAITGMNTFGQQITLYPIHDIPNSGPEGGPPFYVEGEGIALEIRSKSCIDTIKLTAPDGSDNALITGVHMRESFSQEVHEHYGKWGDMSKNYFTSHGLDQYFKSTFNPDGYYGEAGGDTYNRDHDKLPLDMVSAPYSGGPGYYNMYDGYMLNGNINQIKFYDLIGGEKLPFDHGQRTNRDNINVGSFNPPALSPYKTYEDDYQVRSQNVANAIAIEERPMTIQVKTGRTYNQYVDGELKPTYDGRSYVAINWPRHGSVRVQEIQGFVSKKDNPATENVNEGWPYEDFGPSMGSVILDGMRAKKTYIEIPGRAEQYVITEQNNHTYVYDAGKLPDGINQTCRDMDGNWSGPSGQAAWDPIGRGQIDFLNKLGNTALTKPPDTPDLNPTGGRWDLYDISKIKGMETYDFWHLYEPDYPGSGARWNPDH